MSDLKINNITNRSSSDGPTIAGVSTVSTSAFMVMPSGDTAIRGAGSGRGIVAGGQTPASKLDVIDVFTMASSGNATSFGAIADARNLLSGFSDCHGGIDQ